MIFISSTYDIVDGGEKVRTSLAEAEPWRGDQNSGSEERF
jgi:hypothetical protein